MKNILLLLLLILVFGCHKKKNSSDEAITTNLDSTVATPKGERKIVPSDLKTGPGFSTPVISDAQKFIIPVPALSGGGEPLLYPKGGPKAGKPILDYEGKPIGKSGIVFFNFKDQSLQAATGDGKSVIIINEVTQAQALLLEGEIFKLRADPSKLTLKELKQVLEFAHKKLELSDMYNSTRSYVKDKMTPVIAAPKNGKSTDELFGLKKRDDRDINQAIYIAGTFVFEGPAASPQKFDNGGVIIEQGGKMRGVQPDILVRTYKLADGSAITDVVKDIKSQDK
jgi:hypothetical protein